MFIKRIAAINISLLMDYFLVITVNLTPPPPGRVIWSHFISDIVDGFQLVLSKPTAGRQEVCWLFPLARARARARTHTHTHTLYNFSIIYLLSISFNNS